ncbi:hypothetical protein PMAYCL1PPCAC_10652, partial [Pristionchus mayeri]
MHLLIIALLPTLAAAIVDFPTCDDEIDKMCFDTANCDTSGFTGAKCTDGKRNLSVQVAVGTQGCCTGGSADATTTEETTTTAAATVAQTTAYTCVDKLNPLTGVSDCPTRASLCTNSVYLDVMRDQCPRTCGFCSTSGSSGTSGTSGSSGTNGSGTNSKSPYYPCYQAYCTNAIYEQLMRVQCPATCGFC